MHTVGQQRQSLALHRLAASAQYPPDLELEVDPIRPQRRAYGLRDEEYLRLKILTCMLPAL